MSGMSKFREKGVNKPEYLCSVLLLRAFLLRQLLVPTPPLFPGDTAYWALSTHLPSHGVCTIRKADIAQRKDKLSVFL